MPIPEDKIPDLQRSIEQALNIPRENFAYYRTDLYVVATPGLAEWLVKNYLYAKHITFFVSQAGSYWAGAGKLCVDIPFAGLWPDNDKSNNSDGVGIAHRFAEECFDGFRI